jgi:hypothetical protein
VLAEAVGIGIVGAWIGTVLGAVNQYLTASALSNVLSIDVVYQLTPLAARIRLRCLCFDTAGLGPPGCPGGPVEHRRRRFGRLVAVVRRADVGTGRFFENQTYPR